MHILIIILILLLISFFLSCKSDVEGFATLQTNRCYSLPYITFNFGTKFNKKCDDKNGRVEDCTVSWGASGSKCVK